MPARTTPRSKCPVFVVGFPRSGTTLLYDMLLSSGGFAIYLTETHFFTTLAPRFGNLANRKNRERLFAHYLDSAYFRLTSLKPEDVQEQVMEECSNAGDFLRIVMEAMARRQGVGRWAEKTPDHLLYMKQIKSALPGALFIHIIRDGRDAALSVEKQNWVRPFPWDRKDNRLVCGVYWKWMVEIGRRIGATLGSDYMEVRFEDLIQQPQPTLARISEFIDHDLNYDRMLITAIGSLRRPNTSFQDKQDQFNPVGRWRKDFSRSQLRRFEALLGPMLRSLNYELDTPESELCCDRGLLRMQTLYRANFSLRLWAKTHHLPLSRYLVGNRVVGKMRWAEYHKTRGVGTP